MMNRQIQKSIPALCLAALLGAASCSQEEEPSGGGTAFDGGIVFTSPYTLTRSEAMRYGSFREGDQVGVLGYSEAYNGSLNVSSSPWNTKKQFCKPELFLNDNDRDGNNEYNQPLSYAGNGLWEYAWDSENAVGDLHPWLDNSYTYAFFAYYPYVKVSGQGDTRSGTIPFNNSTQNGGMGTITLSGPDQTGDPTITYAMPHSGSSNSATLEWQRVPDLMLAYNVDHTKAKGAVNLAFRHLFCAFEFKVNNYNTEPVTVSNLYVSGKDFYKSVTVTGQESGYQIGNDRYSGQFNVTSAYGDGSFECPAGEVIDDGQGNIVEVRPATVTLTTDGTATADGDPIDLLFIPNEHGKLTADDNASLYLNVTIDGYPQGAAMNLAGASFEPGVRSVFTINIVGNDIYLQMESDGRWDEGGDSDISFE